MPTETNVQFEKAFKNAENSFLDANEYSKSMSFLYLKTSSG